MVDDERTLHLHTKPVEQGFAGVKVHVKDLQATEFLSRVKVLQYRSLLRADGAPGGVDEDEGGVPILLCSVEDALPIRLNRRRMSRSQAAHQRQAEPGYDRDCLHSALLLNPRSSDIGPYRGGIGLTP
jgi:hypothetical protein